MSTNSLHFVSFFYNNCVVIKDYGRYKANVVKPEESMRFIIYKNSILATLFSLFGAVFIAMAVMALVNGELDVLSGIGVIAAGLMLMWLASVISARKEKRKQAKAAKASVADAASTRTAGVSSSAASVMKGKPVKKSAVFAGICFLLAGALGIWNCKRINDMLNSEQVMLAAMGLLMMIAAFRTKHIQEVSVLFVFGFLGLALGSVDVALCTYRDFGFGGYSNSVAVHYMLIFAPLTRVVAYALLMIFALFSTRRIKKYLGGIVRVLWIFPVLALVLAYVKWIDDQYIIDLFITTLPSRWVGLRYFQFIRPELIEAAGQLLLLPAVFFSGFCFQCLCKKTAVVPVQPEPERPAPASPVQQKSVQPQPEQQRAAYEPPKQPAAPEVDHQDLEKKLLAYKDLLDCGILSQEEYNQKIRELMHG